MKKFWRAHSLSIIIIAMVLIILVLSTWATWYEFIHNQEAGKHAHTIFDPVFVSYWVMQAGLNFVAELLGLLTAVLLTKKLRERFSAESN